MSEFACPCTNAEPCHPDCTCVKPFSSRGCSRCCSYGSTEQRVVAAKRLIGIERDRDDARQALKAQQEQSRQDAVRAMDVIQAERSALLKAMRSVHGDATVQAAQAKALLAQVRDALILAADGDVDPGETLPDTVKRLEHRMRKALREIELAHAELDSHGVPRTWGPNPGYRPGVQARIARVWNTLPQCVINVEMSRPCKKCVDGKVDGETCRDCQGQGWQYCVNVNGTSFVASGAKPFLLQAVREWCEASNDHGAAFDALDPIIAAEHAAYDLLPKTETDNEGNAPEGAFKDHGPHNLDWVKWAEAHDALSKAQDRAKASVDRYNAAHDKLFALVGVEKEG